jgi:nucleoside phosphorylase
MEHTMPERIDVLVMTPLPEEMAALIHVLGPPDRKGAEPLAHNIWRRAPLARGTGVLVAFMPTDMDQLPAAEAVGRALETWCPRCFALVGLAASLRDGASLGDVVVARHVWNYDVRRKIRQREDRLEERSAPIPIKIEKNIGISCAQLLQSDIATYEQWQKECLERGRAIFAETGASTGPSSAPVVSIDDVATGSAVVDARIEREKIAILSRKMTALEMEAAGAISRLQGLPAMVVRGLSDAASNKGADRDPAEQAIRQYAAENAARALLRLLQVASLPARLPYRVFLLGGGAAVLALICVMALLREQPRAEGYSSAPSADFVAISPPVLSLPAPVPAANPASLGQGPPTRPLRTQTGRLDGGTPDAGKERDGGAMVGASLLGAPIPSSSILVDSGSPAPKTRSRVQSCESDYCPQ